MNRRRALTVALAAVVTCPWRVVAQPPAKVPRIGWLTSSTIHDANVIAFREGMRSLGYGDLPIEFRAAAGQTDRVAALAAELVRVAPDIIVVDGGPAAIVARRVIVEIPVVVGAMAEPVRDGIVASLARPGGNITGFTLSTGPALVGKRLDLVREAVPRLVRVGIVWNETNAASRATLDDAVDAAKSLGIGIVSPAAVDTAGITRAFDEAARARVGAVVTIADAFFWSQRAHIVVQAARHRLPAIYPESDYVTAGGLMAYGPNVPENFRRVAGYVDRILKGTKPADLPVEQPAKLDLTINLRTARELGLTIPPSPVLRADRVIE